MKNTLRKRGGKKTLKRVKARKTAKRNLGKRKTVRKMKKRGGAGFGRLGTYELNEDSQGSNGSSQGSNGSDDSDSSYQLSSQGSDDSIMEVDDINPNTLESLIQAAKTAILVAVRDPTLEKIEAANDAVGQAHGAVENRGPQGRIRSNWMQEQLFLSLAGSLVPDNWHLQTNEVQWAVPILNSNPGKIPDWAENNAWLPTANTRQPEQGRMLTAYRSIDQNGNGVGQIEVAYVPVQHQGR